MLQCRLSAAASAADSSNLPQFLEALNSKAAVESWYESVKGISLLGPGQMNHFVFLFPFSLLSSGIICVPTSTSESIWAADGNCRLITGLKSQPNGNSCDLLFVSLLTQGKHYLPVQHIHTFISTVQSSVRMQMTHLTCKDKLKDHMRPEIRRPWQRSYFLYSHENTKTQRWKGYLIRSGFQRLKS